MGAAFTCRCGSLDLDIDWSIGDTLVIDCVDCGRVSRSRMSLNEFIELVSGD